MKLIVVAVVLLAGCAHSSGVQKIGPDTYTMSAQASLARGGEAGARSMVLTEANKTCASAGRELLVTNMNAGQYGPGGSASVIFRCLAKGDPDLQRPNYEAPPTATIQSR
jgi:hypothetical protein